MHQIFRLILVSLLFCQALATTNLDVSIRNVNSNENSDEVAVNLTAGALQQAEKAVLTNFPTTSKPIITCALPGSVDNGNVSCSDPRFNVGSTCNFSCHSGYTLSGSPVAACNSSGSWSENVPTCQPPCSSIASPVNGTSSCSVGSFAFNSVCNFSCNAGLTLFGSSSVSCKASGLWSDSTVPSCQIACSNPESQILQSQTNDLYINDYNATLDGCSQGPPFPIGTTCSYSCTDKATHIPDNGVIQVLTGGSATFTCSLSESGDSASWSPSSLVCIFGGGR